MKRVDQDQWRAKEVARLLALVEAERRYYQEIVATMPVGLAVIGADLGFISTNRTFREVFGVAEGDLPRTRLHDLFPGGEVSNRASEVLETGGVQHDIVVQYVSDAGAKPVRISIQPFRGWDEDAASEALMVVQDLEVRPTDAADTAAERTGAVLENLDAIVWERDASTLEFTYVGGRAEEILGFPPEEWTSKKGFYLERIHPEDRDWVTAFYRATVSSSDSRSCEYRALNREGRTIWVRDVIRVVRDESGAALRLSGITVDINVEKFRDEQLVQAEKMAALSRLAGKITHDCNNLLMIMSGYSEELLANLPPDHPSRGDVDEILGATSRLTSLTTELLNFTRRPSLSLKEFSLNSLINSYEPGLRRELGSGIALELSLAPRLAHVKADWDQTGDVVLTLAREARKAMPEGGRLLIETANAEIAAGSPQAGDTLPPGRYVVLAVTDTGPALDEETRTRIFEPFFSSGRSGEDLPSIYTVIRDSGGDIHVTEGPEGGARYTIYLPAVRGVEPAAPPRAERPPVAVPETTPTATVLLAEDEAGIRALVRKILQKQGYTVIEAASGEEALKAAETRRQPIDLLLTDVVMPGIGGSELAEKMTAARPALKVLFMSGYTGDDLATLGPLPEGAAFLQKPFSLTALLDKVRSVLNS